MFGKALFENKRGSWVIGELARLRSQIRRLKSVVKMAFGQYCSLGLFHLKCILLNHLLDKLERPESSSFTGAGIFESFNVLTRKLQRITSRRFLSIMVETVESISSAVGSVQRPGSEVHGGVSGSSVLMSRRCVEGSAGYVLREGMCLFLAQVSKKIKKAEQRAAVPSKGSLARALAEQFIMETTASFVPSLT